MLNANFLETGFACLVAGSVFLQPSNGHEKPSFKIHIY
jgi:dihydroorotate dehydrogenase